MEKLETSIFSYLFTEHSPLSTREWPLLSSFHSLLTLSVCFLLLCIVTSIKSVVTDIHTPSPPSSLFVHVSRLFHHASIIFLSASILFHFHEDYQVTGSLPDGGNYCRDTFYSRHAIPFFLANLLSLIDILFGSLTANRTEINFFSFESHLFDLWKAWLLAHRGPHMVLYDVFLLDCLSLALVHSVKAFTGVSNRKGKRSGWVNVLTLASAIASLVLLQRHLSNSDTLLCVREGLIHLMMGHNLLQILGCFAA